MNYPTYILTMLSMEFFPSLYGPITDNESDTAIKN